VKVDREQVVKGSGKVECHSGHTYAGRPTALYWEELRLEVDEVLNSWHAPDGIRYRVVTTDGRVFELSYDQIEDEWDIHLR
jgi:hypothetical protein